MEYMSYQSGRKVQIQLGEELSHNNLSTGFKSGNVGVGLWAGIAYWR